MGIKSASQEIRIREGDVILCSSRLRMATAQDFDGSKSALFIHGFTADSSYLSNLMLQFEGAGFRTFAFEYACFNGIDMSAKSLKQLLYFLESSGAEIGKLVLVAHSMGGLVARTFIALEGGAKYVRKLITLGTPHNGTLRNKRALQVVADWAESISTLNPIGYSTDTLSAKQLIGEDGPEPLLERLKAAKPPSENIDFLSISGGYPYLEFGKNWLKNLTGNFFLQNNLQQPNDGLVAEVSSNLAQDKFSMSMPNGTHYNSYIEFSKTNHSNLVNNQSLALFAVSQSFYKVQM